MASSRLNYVVGRGRIGASLLACALSWPLWTRPLSAAPPGGQPAARPAARQPPSDPEDLRAEAAAILSRGEFERARREFERVLRLLPYDAPAQRDAARAAQAAGEFEYSAAALERAHHFDEHGPDPELHYLRGEALYVLERPEEARREHRIAELEIGPAPTQRLSKLWLARIYARRGQLYKADALYDSMWPAAPRFDVEVAINHADAHLMHQDWAGGQRVLDRFLERDPRNIRGREMLAWALEAQGDLDRELAVRAGLAADQPTAANLRDWGRALERANDFRAAYHRYEGALGASGNLTADAALSTSIARMRYRITPELGGGVTVRRDPQADSLRGQAGVAVPFGARHHVSLLAWHDLSYGQALRGNLLLHSSGTVTGVGLSVLLASRRRLSLLAGGDFRYASSLIDDPLVGGSKQLASLGAMGDATVAPFRHLEVNVHGDLNRQWNDSAITISEGGTVTGVTGHVYVFPTARWLLIDLGVQLRRLRLAQQRAGENAEATQQLYFGGVDAVLWNSPTRLLGGEILDDSLARRSYLNDAGILSYRHYRLHGESTPDFTARLVLAPEAAIHQGSGLFRKVFARNRGGIDLRGGVGYDTARELMLYSAGVSLVAAPSWPVRVLVSYDWAKESTTGFQGIRHTGWVTYHADI